MVLSYCRKPRPTRNVKGWKAIRVNSRRANRRVNQGTGVRVMPRLSGVASSWGRTVHSN